MEQTNAFNRTIETVGWGTLLVLWGLTILFDFIPFGIGVAGTGLVLLGANAVRVINHIPTRNENSLPGILMLAWGGLELARPLLHAIFESADLDWVIFAILLILLGLIVLLRGVLRTWKTAS
ncbi:MAG: hypothetical protein AB1649_30685 [Chloroflexota bacterium]